MQITVLHGTSEHWASLLRGGPTISAPEELRSAWARLGGRSPPHPEPPRVSEGQLRRRQAAFEGAPALLDALVAAVDDRIPLQGWRAALADADGIVVWAAGGDGALAPALRDALSPGRAWAEEDAGTNALGTALALRQKVVVVGEAHLLPALRGLTCCAVPLFSPDGSLAGVLDVSAPVGFPEEVGLGLAAGLARGVEAWLRSTAFGRVSGGQRELAEALVDVCPGPALLVDRRGRLLRANAPGLAALQRRGGPALPPAPTSDAVSGLMTAPALLGLDWPGILHRVQRGERRFRDGAVELQALPLQTAHGGVEGAVLLFSGCPATPAGIDGDRAIVALRAAAEAQAPRATPLLVVGEPGTGRRRLLMEVAAWSRRGPVVLLDCGALPLRELDRRLFGAGPQGALNGRGTVILAEIEQAPAPVQLRLVRWLAAQDRAPAGTQGPRLLCSATPALAERMQVGSFRADLYARLTAHRLDLPPLRERDDKASLVLELLTELSLQRSLAPPELSPEALSALLARPWPGNVRQLRALLDAALQAASGPRLGVHELALAEAPAPPSGGPPVDLTDLTERALRAALAEAQGNVSEAARRLGVARSSIYRMMARFGLR